MTVRLGYDRSLYEKIKSGMDSVSSGQGDVQEEEVLLAVDEWIEKSLAHTQALMWQESLPSQITLKVLGSPIPYLDRSWTAESSIASLRHLTAEDPQTNLYAFFAADPNYQGTVGIAYVGGICDGNGYQVSISEWRNTVAASGKVVAHEMGHNMGLSHDFAPKNSGRNCNGIMNYGKPPNIWSQCSREDFVATYELITMSRGGQHCMEVIEFEEAKVNYSVGDDDDDDQNDDISSESNTSEEDGDGGGGGDSDDSSLEDDAQQQPTCFRLQWRGDGYCDDENNNAECGFDGGDCCDSPKENWDHFCRECSCLEPRCVSPNWQGDGYCDDENNVEECAYDGGDCCFSEKHLWKNFCKDCQCIDPAVNEV